MSNFGECLERVLIFEGGYSNHSADRGGATNKGITQQTYDTYRINKGLNRQPVVSLSGDELWEIYHNGYWKPIHGDELPQATSAVLFDSAVNSGPRQAIKWLQRVVGAKDDGVFGPATLKSVNEFVERNGDKHLAREIIALREQFIYEIIERNVSQAVFERGWLNRLASLRSTVNEVA